MNEITGAIEKDNKVLCAECGNDLTVEGSVEMVTHIDGIDFYSTTFKCTKCGNLIKQVCERNEEDRQWWADEESEVQGE
jgi:hypothetical protein